MTDNTWTLQIVDFNESKKFSGRLAPIEGVEKIHESFQVAGNMEAARTRAQRHFLDIIELQKPGNAVQLIDQTGRVRFLQTKRQALLSRRNTLYCSFCGKSQFEVKKLIAGPTVFICDECVRLCMDIVQDEEKPNNDREIFGFGNPDEGERCVELLASSRRLDFVAWARQYGSKSRFRR